MIICLHISNNIYDYEPTNPFLKIKQGFYSLLDTLYVSSTTKCEYPFNREEGFPPSNGVNVRFLRSYPLLVEIL